MAIQQYFEESTAVLETLGDFLRNVEPDGDGYKATRFDEQDFAAIWQARELLARSVSVILPLIELELSKNMLSIPAPRSVPDVE